MNRGSIWWIKLAHISSSTVFTRIKEDSKGKSEAGIKYKARVIWTCKKM